jgi:hypothetical protein
MANNIDEQVENVCAAAVERGGVTMPYADLVRTVYEGSGEFKVTHKLIKNSPSEVITRIPAALSAGTYQLKLRTQFRSKDKRRH